MSLPARHPAFVTRTRQLGARRFQALCERDDCRFKGELRRTEEEALEDAALHEAAPDDANGAGSR